MNAEQVYGHASALRRIALQLDDAHAWSQSGPVALAAIVLDEYAAALKLEDAIKRERDERLDGPSAPPARATKPRPPATGPRHKFVNGACVSIHGTDGKVCGKAKGRPGRPPAEPAREPSEALPGVVPTGYRAQLDMTAAADRHVDGGLGSSGVRR